MTGMDPGDLRRHVLSPSFVVHQLSAWAVQSPMRIMTNSAGLTGATPTTTINLPLSMSVCVIVVQSHLTK